MENCCLAITPSYLCALLSLSLQVQLLIGQRQEKEWVCVAKRGVKGRRPIMLQLGFAYPHYVIPIV